MALVERAEHLGGAGINTGTVPSKTLRETALYFSGLRQRGLYGIDYRSVRDSRSVTSCTGKRPWWPASVTWSGRISIATGWISIRGTASVIDSRTVRVRAADGADRLLRTSVILLATGSSPHRPAEVPFDDRLIVDSDSILRMPRMPGTMIVVGGGVIGVEYASIFTALGVRVTLIEGRDRLLSFADGEIATRLRDRLARLGLTFRLGARVTRIETRADHVELTVDGKEQVTGDIVLYAAGRQSNVEGLGLEAVGVNLGKRGLVLVDEKYQTSAPGIFAAGDVIGFPALASTSMEQARVAMVHAFDLKYKERLSPVIPLAVYTVPEIAMVGITEEEARASGTPCLTGRADYERSARGQIAGDPEGMLKLIFQADDKRLLGVHIIGELAAELVHVGAQVMTAGGTIDAFIHSVFNYPTLAECYKYAAYDGLGALARARQ